MRERIIDWLGPIILLAVSAALALALVAGCGGDTPEGGESRDLKGGWKFYNVPTPDGDTIRCLSLSTSQEGGYTTRSISCDWQADR